MKVKHSVDGENNLPRGVQAERLAAQFLQAQGLKLVQQNYSCKYGEIDLIFKDAKTLVFIEVRLRGNNNFGGAAASITATKQGRLIRTAQNYLSTMTQIPSCRFDAVLYETLDGAPPQWIKNAFTV
ncbi:MAG: YraN family protein [Candidatus Nitrotoga sp.]